MRNKSTEIKCLFHEDATSTILLLVKVSEQYQIIPIDLKYMQYPPPTPPKRLWLEIIRIQTFIV